MNKREITGTVPVKGGESNVYTRVCMRSACNYRCRDRCAGHCDSSTYEEKKVIWTEAGSCQAFRLYLPGGRCAENAVKNGTNQVLIYSTIKEKDERR